jgi:hypothetical protein
LIIWDSGESCKENFYDKNEVLRTVSKLVRYGKALCALCKGMLNINGCYPRHFDGEDGERHDGWIVQGHCAACNKYPALVPSFLLPYKHYKAEIIEAVITEYENGNNVEYLTGYAADVSTMRRWVRQFKERGTLSVGWLLSTLLSLYNRRISLLKLQNMTLLRQLARLLCEFRLPKTGSIIGRVNIILTTQNSGFL